MNDRAEPDFAAWRTAALDALRRAGRAGPDVTTDDVDRLLTSTTDEGVTIAPLHLTGPPAPDLGAPADPGSWDVRHHVEAHDTRMLRQALSAEPDGSTHSAWLTAREPAELADALDVCRQRGATVVLDAGEHTHAAARALLEAAGEGPPVRGNLGADPLGLSARTGAAADLRLLTEPAMWCAGKHPGLRPATVDATVYHDAGGGEVEELACALATAVAYLRALSDVGLPVAVACDQLEFRYAASADQFLTVAKLRAARLLWNRVGRACGIDPPRQRQHAVTSRAMMTARVPWNNIVRTTVAAFAAVTGGADAVTVLPFDFSGAPDASRVTRTTHAILRLEAHAARVHDPVAGSWYAERLTRDLATAAWDRFRAIEAGGGIARALADGVVAERLTATRQRRSADVHRRIRPIVGLSGFAQPGDQPQRHPRRDASARAGLPRHRYGEEFERLRDRADTLPDAAVPLVDLGSGAADAAFAADLLAAGGIGTVRRTVPEAVAPAGAALVCLCGTDTAPPGAVADAVRRLRAAGTTRIWAVATPDSAPDADGHLRPGCDAVVVLDALLDDLGAAA